MGGGVMIGAWFFLLNIVGDVMSSKSEKRGFMWNDFLLNGIGRRLGVLVFAAGLGFALGYVVSPELLTVFSEGIFGDVRTVVGAAPFTVPTFLALWWFRTYDSRQQSLRANFEAGVEHIAIDTPISIEIGVGILVSVSGVTSAFDNEIRLTFINRLKRPVTDTQATQQMNARGYRYTYAQQIFRWMVVRGGKWDLRKMALQHQKFTFKDVTLKRILELSDFENPIPEHFPAGLSACLFEGDMTEELFFKGYDRYRAKYNNPRD